MTQITDQLCLQCSPGPWIDQQEHDPVCFDMTYIGFSGDDQFPIPKDFPFHPESLFLSLWYDDDGYAEVSVAHLTYAGQPVTTNTIATLCGGTAPHLWRPKSCSISPDSDLSMPINSGRLFTADGAVYSWNRANKSLKYAGARNVFFSDNDHAPPGLIAELFSEWRANAGFYCDMQVEPTEEPATLAPVTSKWTPEQLSQQVCQRQAALFSDLGLSFEGLTIEQAQELITDIGHTKAETYLDADSPLPTFAVCPVTTHNADAAYHPNTYVIHFFRNFFANLEYQLANKQDQQIMLGAIIAHEIGHHRHFVYSQTSPQTEYEIARADDLLSDIALAVDDFFSNTTIDENCEFGFRDHLFSLTNGEYCSADRIPTTAEFVARLYELDSVVRDLATVPQVSATINHVIENIHGHLEGIADTLSCHMQLFPSAAVMLQDLHTLIKLDNKLSPHAKEVGIEVLANIAMRLPKEAESTWHTGPTDHQGPALRAALTDEELRAMPSHWKDLDATIAEIRQRQPAALKDK